MQRGPGERFAPAVSYPAGSYPNSVGVGDFNGDGFLDLVTANLGSNSVSVLLGGGNGTFAPTVSYPAGVRSAWSNGNDRHELAPRTLFRGSESE